ncbi:hypothetical protein HK104_010143 [Borealophlyctis nickersoniae]|nr:hypothetical protein HK104_010143 [Borealophlyctis nickersoniae]
MDKSDVVIENFKPGTMEKWGLGPDEVSKTNPSLIYSRVSGYGQTGPYAHLPGFASVCEAMGGFRYVTGFPGEAPVRPNISLGDSLAGLHAAFGILLGLIARDKLSAASLPSGQVIDTAIYESVFNMMEAIVPEYDRLGKERQPSGTTVTGIVPTNAYKCKDGKHVIIGGNGDTIYKRLMVAAGRVDLAEDPELASNAGRVKQQEKIDGAIGEWTGGLSVSEVLERLGKAQVPAGRIYSVKDIVEDPHYKARNMLEEVEVNGRPLKVPGISPKLSKTPGATEWAGPDLGQHTDEVLNSVLGLSTAEINKLHLDGVI